jgi:hypothetical protein
LGGGVRACVRACMRVYVNVDKYVISADKLCVNTFKKICLHAPSPENETLRKAFLIGLLVVLDQLEQRSVKHS